MKVLKVKFDASIFYEWIINKIPRDVNYVLVTDYSLLLLSETFVNTYKAKHDVSFVLVLIDSCDCLSKIFVEKVLSVYHSGTMDAVYSFEPKDCKEYGFTYIEQIYSPIEIKPSPDIEYDIYFGGRDKGRLNMISQFVNKALSHEINLFLRIPEIDMEKQDLLRSKLGNMFFEEMLSYDKTLYELNQANCILEIVQEKQQGISWRAVEAFYYNKKLLTNNPNIRFNKYYNPKYIQVFSNLEDIDYEWIKERIDIDYGYQNDYSPINLLKQIEQDLI